jgi:methylated-DNA-[protein]-cysteine S-methyltransferase
LVREGERIAGLYFEHHWYRPPQAAFGPRVDRGFEAAVEQLGEYFAGRRRDFDLPTLLAGTGEQIAVWRLVSRIPYGQTTTYGRLARALGLPIGAREVGKLIGRNPLCILIPCHRVTGANGHLTGYAGGLARKRALLELEGAIPIPARQLTLSLDEEEYESGPPRLRMAGQSAVAID